MLLPLRLVARVFDSIAEPRALRQAELFDLRETRRFGNTSAMFALGTIILYKVVGQTAKPASRCPASVLTIVATKPTVIGSKWFPTLVTQAWCVLIPHSLETSAFGRR